jgi:hypothetical protein
MRKKGLLLDIFLLGMILVVAVFIHLLLRTTSTTNLGTGGVEYLTSENLIFNSLSGISYVDANGRVHQGIVDYDRFTEKNMRNIALPKERGVYLHLFSIREKDGIDSELYINEKTYTIGFGYSEKTKTEPVLIKKGDRLIQGALEISYAFEGNG